MSGSVTMYSTPWCGYCHRLKGQMVREIDALGGAVDDIGAADTAFGHRRAVATVQYTATYDTGPATRATSYVSGFRQAMTPSWGTGAYVNYADASITNYLSAYFGGNGGRLRQVRKTYDPHGFFTQPQDF